MASVNLDTSQRLDITCRKGDTFVLPLEFQTGINTSGWTMHVRVTDTSEGEDNIIIDVGDSEAVVGDGEATNSLLTITVPASIMEGIDSGIYVYDIQNSTSGVVRTFLYGTFTVNEDITV